MMYRNKDNRLKDELLLEIERLRAQLTEAEETLNAIRSGEVDALVVPGETGEQVFTLKGAEHPYRVFIEEMKEGAVALAPDGTILYCNSGFSQIVRKPIENIIGSGISQFVSPDSRKRFKKMLDRGEISSSRGVVKLLGGDGTIVPAHLSINPMHAVNEWAMYIVVTDLTRIKKKEDALRRSRDELERRVQERTAEIVKSNKALMAEILERKQAENELEFSNLILSDIIEFLPDATFVIDAEKKVIAWNRATEEMTGIQKDDILGKGDYAYSVPFYEERRPILINLTLGRNSETEKKYEFLKNDGRVIYAETFVPCLYGKKGGYIRGRASPLFDGDGKWAGAIESVRDITERKHVEEALRASEEKYRSVVESVDFSVSLIDCKFCYLGCNRISLARLRYSAEDIVGKPITDVISDPDEKKFYLKNLQRIYENGNLETHEQEINVNGKKRLYSVTMAPVFDAKGNVSAVTCVGIDITNRKLAEQALQKSEEKYRNIVEAAQEGIWVLDKKHKTRYVNKRLAEMLGYTVEEMIGSLPFCFMDDEARLLAESKMERWKRGFSYRDEFRFLRSDGSDIWTLLSTKPILDASGQYNGILGMVTDISDLKKMEEIRLENETLIYANTVKSEFMSVMSHELRTPLSSIIGYSQLLKENINGKLNEKQEYYVNNVLEGSKHLLNHINSILDMARIEAGKMLLIIEDVSVPDTIEAIVHFMGEQAKAHNVFLKKEMDPELDIIEVDKQKFKQIMLNLLSNAIKFSKEERGTVTIRTKMDGEMARISISDTGIGIKEKDLKRLFLKFEQLDSSSARKYEGTGLGLSITKELVEMHGGTIMVESEFKEGSTFTFSLPIKAER